MKQDKLADFEEVQYWKAQYKKKRNEAIIFSVLFFLLGFGIGVYITMQK